MLTRLQILNYRCLKNIDIRLDERYYVLVGPNASGKSTLFDAIGFLFDFFADGLEAAIQARSLNFQDLVWKRPTSDLWFGMAMEFVEKGDHDKSFRYEVVVEERDSGAIAVRERGFVRSREEALGLNDTMSVIEHKADPFFMTRPSDLVQVLHRDASGVTCGSESAPYVQSGRVRIPDHYSSLKLVGLIAEMWGSGDNSKIRIPITESTIRFMELGVSTVRLDGNRLRSAAPAAAVEDQIRLSADGSNLPWVVRSLEEKYGVVFKEWLAHLGTALGIEGIRVVDRVEERTAYLMVKGRNGIEIPSWGLSEGTLRLIAMTVLAYLPAEKTGIVLLEEPENGVHPAAIGAVFESLSSVYDVQMFR